MIRYWGRSLLAQAREGRTLLILSLCGVALGVGSVVSVDLLNRNAVSAFRGSVRAVTGEADLSVVGRTPALAESLIVRVLATPGVERAWPVVRVTVAVRGRDGLFLDVLGIDPVSEPPLPFTGDRIDPGQGRDRLAAFLTEPGWIAVSPQLAGREGWKAGDTLTVSSGSRAVTLRLGGLVDFRRASPLAGRTLAVMDIAQAQALLGNRGELQEIGVAAAAGVEGSELSDRLARALGPHVQIFTPEARERRLEGLLDAFRLNLTALSLVSLFVGAFLVAASSQAALVRRRHELGVLRVLGVPPRGVFLLILAETATLGALGTGLGVALGLWAAERSVGTVSATLTNIYLLSEIEAIRVDPRVLALAALVGIGGALAGSTLPALDASRRDVRSLLAPVRVHERASRLAPLLALAALLVAGLALVAFWVAGKENPYAGFVLGLGILLAVPLVTPGAVLLATARLPVQGWGFALSVRALAARLQTSAFAVAALGVAVSMLVAITLLVGSFRATLVTWLDGSIRADVFITTESWARSGRQAVLDAGTVAALRETPGVERLERLRQFRVVTGDREIRLAGVDLFPETAERFPLKKGEAREVLRRLEAGAAVVSEPLARKAHLDVGDSLAVVTPRGIHRFAIAGVTYDYSSEAGAALVGLETLERVFGPGPVNNAAIYLASGVDRGLFVERLRARFQGKPLILREDWELRREVLRLFDQTFAVTRILQGMALVVAVVGISLTLLILARERVAELALYRALGAARRQIFGLFVGEGLGMAVLGLFLGAVAGVGLAAILIGIINPATFGWTIRPSWPWGELFGEVAAIVVAAILASLYPAFRASRVPAQELSREEG